MRTREKHKPLGGWMKGLFILIVASVAFSSTTLTAFAGFGISPPYVFNNRLTRGTVFKQQIWVVRSDPTDDLTTTITMNIPEVAEWFSVDKGTSFLMPKGETKVPIVVQVTVPDDANYARYKGAIRVRTAPANPSAPAGGVSIALGAQIDVDIEVVDKIYDFEVRKIRIDDVEEGRRKWGLFFPGKIRFYVTVENTGNTEYGPTKVKFDIYDYQGETLLETTENSNRLKKVAPFSSEEVMSELPTRLSAGQYVVRYAIYKGDEIAQENELTMDILPIGSIDGYEGYGFWGLSVEDKIKVVAVILIPLVALITLTTLLFLRLKQKKRANNYVPRSY